MIRNTAGQAIGAELINATTGAAFAGAVTVYITGDAGTQAIGSVSSGVCTLEGNGYYSYRPAQAETDYALIAFTFVGSGAVPATIQVETVSASQSQAYAAATGVLALTGLQIVTDALEEIGVVGATRELSAEDASLGLRVMNRVLDAWNVDRGTVYGDTILTGTIVPGQPQTVGPSSTNFVCTSRPQVLTGVNLLIGTLRYRLGPVGTLTDWMQISVPTLSTAIPSQAFWDPAWPNGKLYLWPQPTTAYSLELLSPLIIGALALTDTFSLPPGYQAALTLTTAEWCASPFRTQASPLTIQHAREARALIGAANVITPKLVARDAGLPGGHGTYFDYLSGQVR